MGIFRMRTACARARARGSFIIIRQMECPRFAVFVSRVARVVRQYLERAIFPRSYKANEITSPSEIPRSPKTPSNNEFNE